MPKDFTDFGNSDVSLAPLDPNNPDSWFAESEEELWEKLRMLERQRFVSPETLAKQFTV